MLERVLRREGVLVARVDDDRDRIDETLGELLALGDAAPDSERDSVTEMDDVDVIQ